HVASEAEKQERGDLVHVSDYFVIGGRDPGAYRFAQAPVLSGQARDCPLLRRRFLRGIILVRHEPQLLRYLQLARQFPWGMPQATTSRPAMLRRRSGPGVMAPRFLTGPPQADRRGLCWVAEANSARAASQRESG